MEFDKSDWRTFEQGINREWLITNGIGGFACSTIIGANTRRYHGLLIASFNPPVKRCLVLSNLHESIITEDEVFDFHTFQTPGFIMNGFHRLQKFRKVYLPEFTYRAGDVWVKKKIGMVNGKNTVVVAYTILGGSKPSKMNLVPLVNFRDYHHNSRRDYMNFDKEIISRKVVIRADNQDFRLSITSDQGNFIPEEDCYFMNMEYYREKERGLHAVEDHYIPGYYEIEINAYERKQVSIIATCEKETVILDGLTLVENEENRIAALSESQDEFVRDLTLAADNFIVYRASIGSKTIIAGYPWFTDWGRDTMISFTGLTLCTGRFNDAREILYTFSRYVRDGLVPNMFPDEGLDPAYNSVDASLWFFEAVNKFLHYTKDWNFVKEHIYKPLRDTIDCFMKGTRFNIKMDKDSLIWAGSPDTQLTWMDAKVGDLVVTPRHGKAVEINALWYNALKIISRLAEKYSENGLQYEKISGNAKISFINEFWNEKSGYLYDVINEIKDDSLRPNQLIALSLSYPVVEGERARRVIERVLKELYTSYGIRTLSPNSFLYKGLYQGDQFIRDSAYHQGTVWAWLIGPLVDAIVNTYEMNGDIKKRLELIFEPIRDHFYKDACIDSISEIFDGNEPHNPRGCIAQAWSVAEILRTYTEYML